MSPGPATSYALWLGVTGLLALGTARFAWQRRDAPGAVPLALLLLAVAEWALTYALHWASPGRASFWLDATFLGVVSAPVFVWLLARALTQPARPMTPAAWVTLLAVPAVTGLLLLTGDPGGVLFGRGDVLEAHTRLQGGPWFPVVVVHGYALMALSALSLLRFLLGASGVYRRQAGLLLGGLCLPWLVNLVSVLGLRPFPGLDLTPMLFMVTALVFLWALLGFRLFDLVPVARHQLVEQMGEGVVVLDRAGRVADLNAAARRLTDPEGPPPLGRPAEDVFARWGAAAASLGHLGEGARELRLGEAHLEVRVTPLRDRRGRVQGHIVVWRDVTAQRRAEAELRCAHAQVQDRMAQIETLQRELREQSLRDPLTGLHNRRHLQEALLDARAGGLFSVVLLDIDHFKQVNDTLGHAGGDAVLCRVAAYLQAALAPGETACRYGGEEFVVLLPGLDVTAAAARAERWRREIHAMDLAAGGQTVSISVSLGLAGFPAHGAEVDAVLLAADRALYRAKAQGRNRSHVAPVRTGAASP